MYRLPFRFLHGHGQEPLPGTFFGRTPDWLAKAQKAGKIFEASQFLVEFVPDLKNQSLFSL